MDLPWRRPGRRWTWHRPEGKEEEQRLLAEFPELYGPVALALNSLASSEQEPPGQDGVGRHRECWVEVAGTACVIIFVVREDDKGLGGLLLRVLPGGNRDLPPGLHELAAHRLRQMRTW